MAVEDVIEFCLDFGLKEAEEVAKFAFFVVDDGCHFLVEIFEQERILFVICYCFFVDVGDFFLLLEDEIGQFFVFVIFLNLLGHLSLQFFFDVLQDDIVEVLEGGRLKKL